MCVKELCVKMLNRKKRRWWSRPWIMRREKFGASARLLQELQEEDPETYRNVLRMSAPKFQELLELVEPLIKKQNTKLREALPCKMKLEITLRYLATGDSFRSLALLFRVPHNSISVFLPTVLAAIFEVLQPFIKVSSIILSSIFFLSIFNQLFFIVRLKKNSFITADFVLSFLLFRLESGQSGWPKDCKKNWHITKSATLKLFLKIVATSYTMNYILIQLHAKQLIKFLFFQLLLTHWCAT